jgi:hypothetical protein
MKALTQLFSAPPADYTKGRVGWGIPSARDDGAARQESPVRIIELSAISQRVRWTFCNRTPDELQTRPPVWVVDRRTRPRALLAAPQ